MLIRALLTIDTMTIHRSDDCHDDHYCKSHKCVAKGLFGDACHRNHHCHSGRCSDINKCVICKHRYDCGPGKFCTMDGICKRLRQLYEPCSSHRECASDRCSHNGFCVNCQSTAECGTKERCFAGRCRPRQPLGGACLEDGDCLSELCHRRECVGCHQRSCARGSYCADDGMCRAKLQAGECCRSSLSCRSGACVPHMGGGRSSALRLRPPGSPTNTTTFITNNGTSLSSVRDRNSTIITNTNFTSTTTPEGTVNTTSTKTFSTTINANFNTNVTNSNSNTNITSVTVNPDGSTNVTIISTIDPRNRTANGTTANGRNPNGANGTTNEVSVDPFDTPDSQRSEVGLVWAQNTQPGLKQAD
ncbi:hypothetical protein FJT64_001175 [Amphibalanus amphitrite]|uniref:Uncharacterized protein n=1 Tax=Amphibalanus amphitrite TaxID=1232801 RepID=A0A6A4VHP8_AMPAM|nr:hypothetical protein FJT64_001175 [Amphibalanus amphitrite]